MNNCLKLLNHREYLLLFPNAITAIFHKDSGSIYTFKVSENEVSVSNAHADQSFLDFCC